MKDVAKKLSGLVFGDGGVILRLAAKCLAFGFLGFVSARTGIFGRWFPFGVSFVAASPVKRLIFCFAGAALGYLFPRAEQNMFIYLASITAAAAIRLVTTRYLSRSGARLWVFFGSSLLVFLTGAVSKGTSLAGLLETLFEALVAGGAAHFADSSFTSRGTKNSYAVIVTSCILLIGFMQTSLSGVSLGVILAAAAVCLAGNHGGAPAGALCGALCGIACLFANGSLLGATVFVVSGTAAGLVSGYGKAACSSAALLSAICLVAGMGFTSYGITLLSSTLIGAGVYFFLPNSLSARLALAFRRASIGDPAYGMRHTVELKLGFAADALRRVNGIISEVSDKLSKTDKPLFDRVISGVKRESCGGCSFFECCWRIERDETERAMREMARSFHNRRPVSLAELSDSFAARCPRKERVENSIMKFYSRFLDETANDKCAREARNALYDQFGAISEMLEETAHEVARADNYDAATASAVALVLAGLGLDVKQCYCLTDELGRMKVEAVLSNSPEVPLGRARIRDAVGEVCGREFASPEIKKAESEYLLSVCEKTRYSVDYATQSIKADKNALCGDDAEFFTDGKGKAYMIISDGMGTGSRAAIDSRMASGLAVKLLGAGFGYSCTLKMINTAMMYRSGEESLSTLDITSLDLYSGEAELHKAGSAPTFIRRGGYVVRADCKSLPLGILRGVGFDKAASKLGVGDIVLMVSDGAVADGTEWISAMLRDFEGTAEGLCRQIATEANRRRCDGHTDDITVSAAIIERSCT